ncbi:MAG: biotin/lipoyl-containing protein, partial [Pseudomonadota bacterium]
MPIQILMPALSPTMTEGNLAKWLKAEGDTIAAGDVIAEIETDKATMEVEAVDEGTLGKILISEGSEGVAVNTPIAVLLEEGEDASAIDAAASAGPTPAPQPAETAAPSPSAAAPAPAASPKTPPAPPTAAPSPVPGGRILASPLARRLAQQNSLDLTLISGSGPNGRVVKTDIERALADGSAKAGAATPAPAASAAPAPTAAAPAGGGGGLVSSPKDQVVAQAGNIGFTEIPHSGMRKTIARRLTESKQNVPHFYLTVDCELD